MSSLESLLRTMPRRNPVDVLRQHVTGAIERGEAVAIVEVRA